MIENEQKMVLVFFDEKKADEYERRAAQLEENDEEVIYHADKEVIAGCDSTTEDGKKTGE